MKNKLLPIVILVINFVVSLLAYPHLPQKLATHWGANGEVNGYMSKGVGVFFLPLLLVGLYLLLYFVPKVDPRKENIAKFRKSYNSFLLILLLFMTFLHLFTIGWNLGYHFSIIKITSIALSALFYAIGNLLVDAEPNYFIGIRTPWTLANDQVWKTTHELGARLFKATAAVCLLGLVLPESAFWIIIASILFTSFYLVVFSYVEYKKVIKE